MIANKIEIHQQATPFDEAMYITSCNEGLPENPMGIARAVISAVLVPGGVMNAGPELLTLEQLGMYSARCERGEIGLDSLSPESQRRRAPPVQRIRRLPHGTSLSGIGD